MITLLTGLVGSKYGKYFLEIAILAGLVFGAYEWAYHRGSAGQKDADQQQQAEIIEKSRQEAATAKDQVVKLANDKAEAAEARAQAAEDRFATLAALLQGLAAKEKAGTAQVSALPDSQLHGDITSKLGVRQPGDATACYLPQEERAIDNSVTQYPLCQQDRTALQGEIKAKQDEVQAQQDLSAARQQSIDAWMSYAGVLAVDYKQLWDMHPPRYRSARCVWIWKCGKKQVSLEPPAKPAN